MYTESIKNYFGIIGLCIGLIAVGIAVFQDDMRPETPEDDRTLTEIAGEATKSLIREKILKEDVEPDHKKRHDHIAITYMSLGFIALGLGVASWVRRDHMRISFAAVGLGLCAIAWEYVLVGVGVAALLIVLSLFGS